MVKMDFVALDVGGAVRCTDDSRLARLVRIQNSVLVLEYRGTEVSVSTVKVWVFNATRNTTT